MNSFDSQRQDSLKRRWQKNHPNRSSSASSFYSRLLGDTPSPLMGNPKNLQSFPGGFDDDDDLVSNVLPPVTVVLEGRSICQRISLHNHASYHSLAKALRQMFVDGGESGVTSDIGVDLSNAVPGHLIAYEDMENDLLLVGDLNWKDFVRVAKRIRILPSKSNSRKGTGGA
ncbi:unnamed protein product [Ilex paraguariensis]|uniref:Auxin-responsive protein n=1 Tax=Ilex paraguariensis TaxID=185542 RepID=A0ABC8QZN8_9AQUA